LMGAGMSVILAVRRRRLLAGRGEPGRNG
jgi:hypothetical protein